MRPDINFYNFNKKIQLLYKPEQKRASGAKMKKKSLLRKQLGVS